ncbi:MAG: ABC transporter permease [Saprospiraceae bacterium]|nr:ABC transporter permease [Saprospiraceae bacterium]
MQSTSSYQKAWQRFRRNKPAFAGLGFIVLAAGIAVFGYLLAPDDAPDANTQMVELALQEPGFRAELLPVFLARDPEKAGWFSGILFGKESAVRLIPIQAGTLQLRADSVYFQRVGAKNKVESTHLVTLFSSLRDSIQKTGDTFVFTNASGQQQRLERAALLRQFQNNTVVEQRTFWLGADKYGRCILSRLLLGFRISLLVGGIAVLISLTIGLFIGALGGYFGGRVDDAVMLLVNTVWSIPTLLLVFAIVLALGRGIGIIFLAVGLTMWVDVARVVRGQVLALRDLPFVEAAQSMGFSAGRIIFRHILPNLMGPVLVVAAGNFATAVLVESGLSYLGFGVQPPAPSWGTMLNENYGYALGGKPLLAIAPALAIAAMVLAFNLVGNGLRDALDVRSES